MNDLNKKLNICLALDSFFPSVDGVINVVDNYYKELSINNNCCLLVPKYPNYKDLDKYNIYRIISTPVAEGYRCAWPMIDFGWKNFLDENKPDIIHIHSPFNIGDACLKYAKKNNIPIILSFHTKYYDDFKRVTKNDLICNFLLKRIIKVCNNVDGVFTFNQSMIDTLKQYGCSNSIQIISNATDFIPFTNPDEIMQEVNAKYSIDPNDMVFTFIGRLVKDKNVHLILEALSLFVKNTDKFKFLIIGSGKEMEALKTYVKQHSLEKNVIFLGWIDKREEIAKILTRADLNFVINNYDSSSLSLIEASCFNTPTVVFKGSTVQTNIIDKVNGYVCEENPNSIIGVLLFIQQHRNEAIEIAKNAHIHLYKTWNFICNHQVLSLYKQIIAKNKK